MFVISTETDTEIPVTYFESQLKSIYDGNSGNAQERNVSPVWAKMIRNI